MKPNYYIPSHDILTMQRNRHAYYEQVQRQAEARTEQAIENLILLIALGVVWTIVGFVVVYTEGWW